MNAKQQVVAQIVAVIILLVLGSPLVSAQADTAEPHLRSSIIDSICTKIRSEDRKQISDAVKDIEGLLKISPIAAAHELAQTWTKWLWGAERYTDLNRLCQQAILAAPASTDDVQRLQRTRVECSLQMKSKSSSVLAKSLYNVSTLDSLSSHFDLVAKALSFKQPKESGIAKRFLKEQNDLGFVGASVLNGINATPDPELGRAIATLGVANPRSLMGKVNLLLIADQPTEALALLEAARTGTKNGESSTVLDGIARAMKAKDGHPQRARTWRAQQEDATSIAPSN